MILSRLICEKIDIVIVYCLTGSAVLHSISLLKQAAKLYVTAITKSTTERTVR